MGHEIDQKRILRQPLEVELAEFLIEQDIMNDRALHPATRRRT